MDRIRSLFQVEAGEAGLVGAVSLIFLLLQTTHALTANSADTLFGVRSKPSGTWVIRTKPS